MVIRKNLKIQPSCSGKVKLKDPLAIKNQELKSYREKSETMRVTSIMDFVKRDLRRAVNEGNLNMSQKKSP